MASNYPPGVTGNEFAITGSYIEEDVDDYTCTACGHVGGTRQGHPDEGTWITCNSDTCDATGGYRDWDDRADDDAPENEYDERDDWDY